jgi:hypothetical protein
MKGGQADNRRYSRTTPSKAITTFSAIRAHSRKPRPNLSAGATTCVEAATALGEAGVSETIADAILVPSSGGDARRVLGVYQRSCAGGGRGHAALGPPAAAALEGKINDARSFRLPWGNAMTQTPAT